MEPSNFNTNPSSGNKKVLIGVAAAVFLFIFAFTVLLFANRPKVNQTGENTDQTSAPSNESEKMAGVDKAKANIARQATAPPQVAFSTWMGMEKPPGIPSSLNMYPLKQTFTTEDVRSLASKLKTSDYIQKTDNVVTSYSITDNKEASVLLFNVASGEFSYRSNKGIALPTGATTEDKSYGLLRMLGWYDPTIEVTATYRNSKKPGMLYVELHRNWEKVGAPVLNPIGLFNLPEEQTLSSLTLNTNPSNTPKDADIIGTSDNRNGFARATDFNTITLAINESAQTVNLIKSNIRPISGSATAASLISFDRAVENLKNKKQTFIFTSPVGEGTAIAWDKVYPGNMASANTAEVTETTVAYLENSPASAQKVLEPYYVFRGKAKLNSGYSVLFTAAVPASTKTLAYSATPEVAGVMAQAGDTTQKQGTFEGATPVKQSTPVPGAEQTSPTTGVCQPSAAELNPVYDVNGLTFGWASYTYWKGEFRNAKSGYWYYVPATNTTASVVESNLDNIIAALQSINPKADVRDETGKIIYDIKQNVPGGQSGSQVADSNDTGTGSDSTQKQGTFDLPSGTPPPALVVNNIVNTIQAATDFCPVRLTGGSPTLFVYGATGSKVAIEPVSTYTYIDTALNAGKWNVEVNGVNNLVVNGLNRPYIFYEYQKVKFDRPNTGWIVKRSALDSWVRGTMAKAFGLNALETERALFELSHAAADVTGSTLFVGIVDEKEVNNKVPLKVNGASVRRVHLYVGKAEGAVNAPTVTPISRNGSYVLEIGSHAE